MWAVCLDCCSADCRGLWEKQNNITGLQGEVYTQSTLRENRCHISNGQSADQVIRLSRAEQPGHVELQRSQFAFAKRSTLPHWCPYLRWSQQCLIWSERSLKLRVFRPKCGLLKWHHLRKFNGLHSAQSHSSVDFPSKFQANQVSHVVKTSVKPFFISKTVWSVFLEWEQVLSICKSDGFFHLCILWGVKSCAISLLKQFSVSHIPKSLFLRSWPSDPKFQIFAALLGSVDSNTWVNLALSMLCS